MMSSLDHAFILAAGHGTRMRPLTDSMPKPMVEIRGKPIIDHALKHLNTAGVKSCVVNTHYKGEILHEHLKDHVDPNIVISHEEKLLDTGGGIKNALKHLPDEFIALNGDAFWENPAGEHSLSLLAQHWNPDNMDILMLLQPVETMQLTEGVGDYHLDKDGKATRALDKKGRHMFTSLRVQHKRIFEDTPEGAFSFRDLMDRAQEQGRLFGLIHTGQWHHISTPQDVEAVNEAPVKSIL